MSISLENMWILIKLILTLWISSAHGQEIACTRPYIPNGVYKPDKPIYRVDDLITYECKSEFHPSNKETTVKCTDTGWLPAPRCIFKPCDFPKIPHGFLFNEDRYKPYFPAPIGKTFFYYCHKDYVSQSNNYYGTIKCTQSGWEPMPTELCRRKCIFNYLENGKYPSRFPETYQQGQSVKAECYSGYSLQNGQSFMTCTENGWDPPPRCIRIKTCLKSDAEIQNGFLSESDYVYSLNKQAQYKCKQGYITANGEIAGSITCQQSGWSEQPVCIKFCDRPEFEKARTQNNRTWFKLNDQLDYECELGYENKEGRTSGSIVCGHNDWSDKPECFGKCIFNYLENGHYPWISETYYEGQSVRAECYFGYSLQNGESNMTCTETGWNPPPRCILINATGKCGAPPTIANGDITSFPLQEYAPESEIEYKCQNLYKLEGDEIIRCHNGQWSQPPKCLNPCVISEDIMNKHRIRLRWKDKNIHYVQSGEFVEFACKRGSDEEILTQLFRQICIDGKITYPTCG